MFDFDFSFNKLKIDEDYVFGTLLRQESKERIFFNPDREVRQVRALIPSLPKQNQTFKMLSLRGGSPHLQSSSVWRSPKGSSGCIVRHSESDAAISTG